MRRVGKAKRAHRGPFLVGTARKSAPLPTLRFAFAGPLNRPGGNMGKNTTDRAGVASGEVSRRAFLSTGAAGVPLAAGSTREANAQSGSQRNWDRSADVVVIGAGVAGVPAAATARHHDASGIVGHENYDIGRHRHLGRGEGGAPGGPA